MNRLLEERRQHQEKGENGYESKRGDKERTKQSWNGKFMENMNNPKKLWKILKQVAPTKPRPTNFSFIEVNGQQINNPVGISNAFNEHFVNIQQTNLCSRLHKLKWTWCTSW